MKLAILLFGHLRTFEYSSKFFIKNLVNKYDCDIFIHTWDETDSNTKCWQNREKKIDKVDKKLIKQINSIYNPKKLVIGHQNNENEILVTSTDGEKKLSLNGMKYMFESMDKANKLRKDYELSIGIKYDYILVTRPDVAIYNYLDIEETIKEAKDLNIDIEHARFFCGLYGSSQTNVRLLINRVPDILFFAVPSVIDRFIAANSNLSFENINNKFKNVVSIYVRNEIKAGIIPFECCFGIDKDWKNHTKESLQTLEAKQKKADNKLSIKNIKNFILRKGKK